MKKLLTLLLLLLALVSAACGSDDDPTVDSGDDAAGSGAMEHNDADVAFAQGMSPHHEQAIEMAEMVLKRGDDPEVKALAEDIKAAQGPEIETLRGWLEDWGEEESGDAGHGDMGGDDGMMMRDDEMEQLENASGEELDKMFLEMMIRHHEGAISMAETELEEGMFPAAKEMAQNISDTQQAEITKMKDLLTKLGG